MFSGIDFYFDSASMITLSEAIEMNTIFTISGGVSMLVIFIILMSNETTVMKFFKEDSSVVIFNIVLSIIIMYFVKNYLISKYELVFNYPNLIILSQLVLMMVIPYTANRFIRAFGKAFAH